MQVFATLPVHKMGLLTCYDLHTARRNAGDDPDTSSFTLDEVDDAFRRIHQLRYQQRCEVVGLPGPLATLGMVLTPFTAGRLVGGTVWRLSVAGEQLLYAVDWSHKKEEHLVGAALDSVALRPALMIADAAAAALPSVVHDRRNR